jgi:hypothetical protein
MSVSSEVQRTLVKSPPELWAELSDPTTLARHLGELGEIRIVRTEPDRAVDWEAAAADGAQAASGRVEIEPSGWGTRVTLTASRAIVAPAPEPEPEADAEAEPEVKAKPEPEATVMEVALDPGPPEVEADPEPAPEPQIAELAPRRGFFARLFRRRKGARPEPAAAQPETEPAAETETEPATAEPEPEPIAEVEIAEPEATAPEPETPAPEPDISAELAELEEQTTAVLTGVLDRLGAAHHRPFSRG